jgi:CheY-like chemotaxis protein
VDRKSAQRLLVVDDEEFVRKFAERVLRDAGYDVVVAAGAAEALALLDERGPFDLFVLDVRMPQMEGDELAHEIRRRIGDSKILYLTGAGDRLFQQQDAPWGDEAVLAKPASRKGLAEAVALMLGAWPDEASQTTRDEWPAGPPATIEIDLSGLVELGTSLMRLRQLSDEWFQAAGDRAKLREVTTRLRPALDAAMTALRRSGHQ